MASRFHSRPHRPQDFFDFPCVVAACGRECEVPNEATGECETDCVSTRVGPVKSCERMRVNERQCQNDGDARNKMFLLLLDIYTRDRQRNVRNKMAVSIPIT